MLPNKPGCSFNLCCRWHRTSREFTSLSLPLFFSLFLPLPPALSISFSLSLFIFLYTRVSFQCQRRAPFVPMPALSQLCCGCGCICFVCLMQHHFRTPSLPLRPLYTLRHLIITSCYFRSTWNVLNWFLVRLGFALRRIPFLSPSLKTVCIQVRASVCVWVECLCGARWTRDINIYNLAK